MIEPNTIYLINKDNFANLVSVLVKIYLTRKNSKLEEINCDKFMDYFTKMLACGKCITLVSFNDKKELNACAVLLIKIDPFEGNTIWLQWVWSNEHDSELGKKYVNKMEDIARKLKIKKIVGATKRNTEAFFRKYGFKETYKIIEREVDINENKKDKSNVQKNIN